MAHLQISTQELVVKLDQLKLDQLKLDQAVGAESLAIEAYPVKPDHAYYELPQHDSRKVDVLSQFRANLNQLEDLSHRMTFMVGELKSLIRK